MSQTQNEKAPVKVISQTKVDIIMPTVGAIMRCGKCHQFDWGIYVKPHMDTAKIAQIRCKNCGHTLNIDDGVPDAKEQSWDRR